ncbi:NAD(P)/FAD-dependent oxidoreductase [Ferruginibacter yonginensis]|uniref:NAD(P)/FAD-dependent oxidoreductase n=1 Tax=Ferruginibacter yonginensis TaxID=1310416 RepID=A0ABV8QSH7_9BACT
MSSKVIIIGNGIAGITCARHIRKYSDFDITVISSESKYFYSRTALMYIYMGHMKQEHTQPYEPYFWEKNRIHLIQAHVAKVSPEQNTIILEDDTSLNYDFLVIATGSKSNKFGWPGQDLAGVQGLYNLQDLESMEKYTNGIQQAVVVGGGLIGIETVEMLLSRNIKVSFLIRENSFWDAVLPADESNIINNLIQHHHVDLQLGTELKEIIGNNEGRVKAIVTSKGETIPCGFVALTVGVSPNIAFLKDSKIAIDKGVLVNNYFQTNFENVFAIGDCAQFQTPIEGRRPLEQVWYTGKMHGETAAQNIVGNLQKYQPGHWFNSAKFFDLEYQTYGLVPAQLAATDDWFWWQDAKGNRALRLMWHKETKAFKGLNTFGIRIRHEVCNEWLNQQTPVDVVVQQLSKANFDPEFFKKYEHHFQQAFVQSKKLHAL